MFEEASCLNSSYSFTIQQLLITSIPYYCFNDWLAKIYHCFKSPIGNKRADVEQSVAVPGVKSLSNIAYESVPDLVFTRVSLFQILWTAGLL